MSGLLCILAAFLALLGGLQAFDAGRAARESRGPVSRGDTFAMVLIMLALMLAHGAGLAAS